MVLRGYATGYRFVRQPIESRPRALRRIVVVGPRLRGCGGAAEEHLPLCLESIAALRASHSPVNNDTYGIPHSCLCPPYVCPQAKADRYKADCYKMC